MNNIEKKMVEVLLELKEKFGVFEVKAEFEAEGSRLDELMRLKDVTSKAGLPIILKVGGVEAVTDVYSGLTLGVSGIIAPMAETKYAASKFTDLIDHYIADDNAENIDFSLNIETIVAYQNFDDILSLKNIGNISGITVGRVDMIGSMGLDRGEINTSKKVEDICRDILIKSKRKYLKTALGGGVSIESSSFISSLNDDGLLDKFETRKVVFPSESIRFGQEAILKAVEFELLWLEGKQRFYSLIKNEDLSRIEMLRGRLNG